VKCKLNYSWDPITRELIRRLNNKLAEFECILVSAELDVALNSECIIEKRNAFRVLKNKVDRIIEKIPNEQIEELNTKIKQLAMLTEW
jgi:hypothetical protein